MVSNGGRSSFGIDEGYFGGQFREVRHNPCLMSPISLILFIIFGLFLFVTLLFQLPGLLLGLLMAPILARSPWYVEFLYPWGIGRSLHLFLLGRNDSTSGKGKDDDKNRGFHSRCVEQRVEVVPGRVFIHPIPQLLDNVGYLLVCVPRPTSELINDTDKVTIHDDTDPVVALMIDCGDAIATIKAMELIQRYHYRKKSIQLQAICSTHKHHDHTGGNKQLLETYQTIQHVYGGAVEKVPCCDSPVTNREQLILPKSGFNDMGELIEMEVVAVPAHTRGSLVFRLRSKHTSEAATETEYLFTGDTIF